MVANGGGCASDALLKFGSFHPARFVNAGCCPLGGPSDENAGLFPPRNRGAAPAISRQLECGAMPGTGTISVADWPRTDPALGDLFICRSVNANKLVVRIFGRDDIVDCHAIGKLCLDRASLRPQLEAARRVSAVVPAHHRFPRALVGDGVLGNRVDVGGSFDAAANPHILRPLRAQHDMSDPDNMIFLLAPSIAK
jgi:hypothetical protein